MDARFSRSAYSGVLGGTMRRFVTLAVLILATSLSGQVEHAPTVAQCQADQRLWLSRLEVLPTDTNLPAFTTLQQWSSEMGDCKELDPKNAWSYFNVQAESNTIQAGRMLRFLSRQHLWDKFLEEDSAGKR
jgi:hypothetical protein